MTMHKRHNPTVIEQCSHFNDCIDEKLRTKLHELATAAKDDFIADLGGWPEPYGTRDISAIYGHAISGFIPSQLGGFEVTELYRYDTDSTYHITKAQSDYADKRYNDCIDSFSHDYRDELNKAGYADGQTFTICDLPEKLQESFYDYENEWFEPALLRLEIWVDDTKNPLSFIQEAKTPSAVYVRLGVNYKDQPYYRSQYDETIFEESITIDQAMRFTPETFIAFLKDRYEKADA